MQTGKRTPPGEPEDVVSSGHSPMVAENDSFRLSRTIWSIVVVVAVMIGGVVVVQWATRSSDSNPQESSLSGLEVDLPSPQQSAPSGPASTSASPTRTSTAKAAKSATPTPSTTAGRRTNSPRNETAPPAPRPDNNNDETDDENNRPRLPRTTEPDPPPATTRTEDPAPGPTRTEPADPSVNLAAGRAVQATSQMPSLGAGNVTDGDQNSYWESNAGFPQTLTVDLGQVATVGRMVLALPTEGFWHRRTQTITVLGSTDGGSFSPLKGSAAYQFRGSGTDNQASLTFPPTPARFVQLRFTGSNGWFAAQLSGLSVHSS